jgi:tight adherence protein B
MAEWLAALSLTAAIVLCGPRQPGRRLATLWSAPIRHNGSAMPALIAVGVAIGGALAAARVPLPLFLFVAGMATVGWRVRRVMSAVRAREECAAATVEVTFALAGELRAGRTPVQALGAVASVAGPLRPALEAAGMAVGVGADAAEEIARAALLPGAERLRYVAAAWSVADSAGGRVAVVLERLCEAMDSDDELRRELDAAMAGPRATMVLLACLPVLGLALGQAVGAHPLQLLVHRPLGWGLLAAAATLDGLGVVVTRAIARVALRA